MVMRDCVVSYFQIYPPNPETIYNAMYEQTASKVFGELRVPSKKRAEFDAKVVPEMKAKYDAAQEAHDTELVALEKKQKARAAALAQAEKLGRRAKSVKEDIAKFEALVYAQHGAAPGGTVYNYLFNALFPYVFLSGPIAPHAKVFRAKLANGDYNFAKLAQANLGHFAPELVMEIGFEKDRETKKKMALVNESLISLLDGAVSETVKLYYSILNPTLHRPLETSFWAFVMKNDKYEKFLGMFGDPREICERDTGSGFKKIESKLVGGEIVTTREPITDGDLVICYRKGKFTCHDSTEIARQIKSGNTTNPYTGKPFPEGFVDKIKTRYFAEKDVGIVKSVAFGAGTKTKSALGETVVPKKDTRPRDSIVVMGPANAALSLFGDEIDLSTGETIYFTNYVALTDRVVVLSVDLDEPEGWQTKLNKDYPKEPKKYRIFVIGVGSDGKSLKTLEKIKQKIQKEHPATEEVYFAPSSSAEDVTAAIETIWKGLVKEKKGKKSKSK